MLSHKCIRSPEQHRSLAAVASYSGMSIRRIKVQRRSLKPTKIALSAAKAQSSPPPEWTPTRRDSYVSAIYGRLLEDKDTEDMCMRLGMKREEVRQLRRKFDDEDGSHSDTVTLRGFFHLINDDKAFDRSHILIKELLRLAGVTTSVTRVTFDQFLHVVCIFAAYSETQLWRFFYDAFFAGGIDSVNARTICEVLQAAGTSYARNIEVAARRFTANAVSPLTGLTSAPTFEDFVELVRRNPVVFFPLVQLQRNVRARTLGEKYWERKVHEQNLVPPLIAYLQLHRGRLPRMSLKDWTVSLLLGGHTAMARARALARRQYYEDIRMKA